MSAGTKVFLAAAVVFVAVLVGYYGVFTPQPIDRPTDPIATEPDDEPAGEPAAPPTAERSTAERKESPAIGLQHLVPARRGTRMTSATDDVPDATREPAPGATASTDTARVKGTPAQPSPSPAQRTPSSPGVSPRTSPPSATAGNASPSRTVTSATASGDRAKTSPDRTGARTTTPKKKTAAAPVPATPKPASASAKRTTPPPSSPPSRGTAKPPTTVPYTIRSGDTLSSIAARQLGDARHWSRIARANPLQDPNRLKVGDVIRIPAAGSPSSASARRRATPPRASTGTVKHHVVRSGETLSDIAYEHYGDSALWQVLYDANRPVIGTSPDRLEVGMRLVIPRKP